MRNVKDDRLKNRDLRVVEMARPWLLIVAVTMMFCIRTSVVSDHEPKKIPRRLEDWKSPLEDAGGPRGEGNSEWSTGEASDDDKWGIESTTNAYPVINKNDDWISTPTEEIDPSLAQSENWNIGGGELHANDVTYTDDWDQPAIFPDNIEPDSSSLADDDWTTSETNSQVLYKSGGTTPDDDWNDIDFEGIGDGNSQNFVEVPDDDWSSMETTAYASQATKPDSAVEEDDWVSVVGTAEIERNAANQDAKSPSDDQGWTSSGNSQTVNDAANDEDWHEVVTSQVSGETKVVDTDDGWMVPEVNKDSPEAEHIPPSRNKDLDNEASQTSNEWHSPSETEFVYDEGVSNGEEAGHDQIYDNHDFDVFDEEHDGLFPLTESDWWGFVLATMGLLLAAGGGIGGGGMLVPIYCLVLGFSPKHAIPLSNITVFGGALANTILNARKRHPTADRPLMDWDLILIMEPLTIAGALMGALINKVLPEVLLTVLLVLLLAVTAQKTLSKALKLYRKESADMIQESELTKLVHQEEQVADEDFDVDSDLDEEESEEAGVQGPQSEKAKELQLILEEERNHSGANIAILVVMFIFVLVINVLKGGGAFPSPLGIKCGSSAFWSANVLLLVWILAIALHGRAVLLHKFRRKESCDYCYETGDIVWDERATTVYPIICALAGFFAGMFGIGGGIVKGPLMLAMGVHPAVSSASTACMILFTSFTATTSFVVFGLLVTDYAVMCFIIGFCATLVGQIVLSYLMKKAGRNSYIAFSIGGVVLVSAVLMTIQSLLSMAEGEHHNAGGICGKDE